ncbi:hypothetical protein, partial [Candidatus Ichthyocystis hellenicum]|uniref:hypothetical protein n=1 Tax=Candidatus Ichthyocystis hellenicum TaxID=1561003 RepID=UPI001112A25F
MNSIDPNKVGGNAGESQGASGADGNSKVEDNSGNKRISVSSDTSNVSRAGLRPEALPKAPSRSRRGAIRLSLPKEAPNPMQRSSSSESLASESSLSSTSSDKIRKAAAGKVKIATRREMGRLKASALESDENLRAGVRRQLLNLTREIREELKEVAQKRPARLESGHAESALEEKATKLEKELLSLAVFVAQLLESHDRESELGKAQNLNKEQMDEMTKLLNTQAAEARSTQKELEREQQQRPSTSMSTPPVAAPRTKLGADTGIQKEQQARDARRALQRALVPPRVKKDLTAKPQSAVNVESRPEQNPQQQRTGGATKQKPQIPPKPANLVAQSTRDAPQKPQIPPKPANLDRGAIQKPQVAPKPANLDRGALQKPQVAP